MTRKKIVKVVQKAWYEELGVKYDKVTEKGNVVCKKLSKKSIKELKEAGYVVRKLPNGSYVICHK